MTPKEKALTLIHTFTRATLEYDTGRQCALIAVDELIKNSHSDKRTEYWKQVKYEIEQL